MIALVLGAAVVGIGVYIVGFMTTVEMWAAYDETDGGTTPNADIVMLSLLGWPLVLILITAHIIAKESRK